VRTSSCTSSRGRCSIDAEADGRLSARRRRAQMNQFTVRPRTRIDADSDAARTRFCRRADRARVPRDRQAPTRPGRGSSAPSDRERRAKIVTAVPACARCAGSARVDSRCAGAMLRDAHAAADRAANENTSRRMESALAHRSASLRSGARHVCEDPCARTGDARACRRVRCTTPPKWCRTCPS